MILPNLVFAKSSDCTLNEDVSVEFIGLEKIATRQPWLQAHNPQVVSLIETKLHQSPQLQALLQDILIFYQQNCNNLQNEDTKLVITLEKYYTSSKISNALAATLGIASAIVNGSISGIFSGGLASSKRLISVVTLQVSTSKSPLRAVVKHDKDFFILFNQQREHSDQPMRALDEAIQQIENIFIDTTRIMLDKLQTK